MKTKPHYEETSTTLYSSSQFYRETGPKHMSNIALDEGGNFAMGSSISERETGIKHISGASLDKGGSFVMA
jgi:hypothetical protein